MLILLAAPAGQVPGPVIRVNKGDILRATFASRLPQPTSVHQHGVALRNNMDGTLVTQQQLQPGAAFTYQFRIDDPGTYWYHPHIGTQQDRGLYGMLIVDDPAEPGPMSGMGSSGSMGSMRSGGGSGVLLPGAMSPLLGGDAGDVRYPGYLINGRVATAPRVFTGKPGQRVPLDY